MATLPRPHIQLRMIVRMALLNLKFKRFRSFITILGIVIGIGSIFMLVSFGLGLQQLVQGEIIGNESINTVDVTPSNSKLLKLTSDNLEQVRSIAHVTDVSGVFVGASKVSINGSSADLVAYGIDPLYMKLSNIAVTAGEPITNEATDQIVVNSSFLTSAGIADPAAAIGKGIELMLTSPDGKATTSKQKIVGVVDSGVGSEVFVAAEVFQQAGIDTFTQAKAVVDERDSISDVRRSIESLGYETSSPVDTLDQVNEVFRFLNIILISLGGVGMVIAILGMLNTLTVSLLERTKEIALMIAIGARPKDMRRLFTVEAIVLSLIGGAVGILLATLLGLAVDFVLNQFASDRGIEDHFSLFAHPPLLIISALLFMVLIGILVSFVPARRAAKINPIEALRQE